MAGAAVSSNATLAVTEPVDLKFNEITLQPGNQVSILLAGENGTYTIYWASNLIDWLILTNVTITNGPVEFIDPINGEAQRFYRASPAP